MVSGKIYHRCFKMMCYVFFVQFNKTMPPLSVPIRSRWLRAKSSRLDSPEFFKISVDFSLLVTCGESAEVPCRMLILFEPEPITTLFVVSESPDVTATQ